MPLVYNKKLYEAINREAFDRTRAIEDCDLITK